MKTNLSVILTKNLSLGVHLNVDQCSLASEHSLVMPEHQHSFNTKTIGCVMKFALNCVTHRASLFVGSTESEVSWHAAVAIGALHVVLALALAVDAV